MKKITHAPAFLVPMAKAINKALDNFDRGIVVDSNSVRSQKLHDGRVMLHVRDASPVVRQTANGVVRDYGGGAMTVIE